MENIIMAAVIAGVILLFAAILVVKRLQGADKRQPFEDMEGHEFEYFCAELLKERGFLEVADIPVYFDLLAAAKAKTSPGTRFPTCASSP